MTNPILIVSCAAADADRNAPDAIAANAALRMCVTFCRAEPR